MIQHINKDTYLIRQDITTQHLPVPTRVGTDDWQAIIGAKSQKQHNVQYT